MVYTGRMHGEDRLWSKLLGCLIGLLIAACGPAWADPLSEPPAHWQGKLRGIPEADISGAEPSARKALDEAREKTAELITSAASDPAELAWAFGNLGNLYQLYDVHTLAELSYINAQVLEPDNFRWAYYIGYLAFSDGRMQSAIDWFEKAAQFDPDYPALGLRLGRAWYELSDFEQAREVLEGVDGAPGLRAAALYYLGQIDLLERDYERAVERFQLALTIDPQASRIHYPLARAYRALGDAEGARRQLALQGPEMPSLEDPLVQELKALETGARPHYIRAMEQVEQGEYQAAAESFRQGLERDPENGNARISLSRTLYLAGEPNQARQGLEQVLSATPHKVLALFLMAVLLDGAGDRDQAETLYRRVLGIDPQHAGAHFFLANKLLRQGKHREAAEHYAFAGADNPPARLYRLVALYRSGQSQVVVRDELQAESSQHPNLQMLQYALVRLLALSQDPEVRDPALAVTLATELVMGFAIPPYLEALALAQGAAGDFEQAIALQNQLLAGAVWMGAGPYQDQLQAVLEGFERGQLPDQPWPEHDPILTPQPLDPAAVFREYPSAVPY